MELGFPLLPIMFEMGFGAGMGLPNIKISDKLSINLCLDKVQLNINQFKGGIRMTIKVKEVVEKIQPTSSCRRKTWKIIDSIYV